MTRMYPVVRDPRSQNRFFEKRIPHTGGPHSGKMSWAIPVKAPGSSLKGLAKIANPVIPVHRKPIKAGTGTVHINDKTEGRKGFEKTGIGQVEDVSQCIQNPKRQRTLSACKREHLERWIVDSGASFHLVKRGDLPVSVQRHIHKAKHPLILMSANGEVPESGRIDIQADCLPQGF